MPTIRAEDCGSTGHSSAPRCGVCGGTAEGRCQTPSGRHWYAIEGGDAAMPEPLRVAMTDPVLRTPEEQAALDRWCHGGD